MDDTQKRGLGSDLSDDDYDLLEENGINDRGTMDNLFLLKQLIDCYVCRPGKGL